MSIDKPRITAVATLEALGFFYTPDRGWLPPIQKQVSPNHVTKSGIIAQTDAMHALLVHRADALEGCLEASEEEIELRAIADVVGAYEAKRWPDGKIPGGKG